MNNYIEINQKNIDTEHICCAIGNDKKNKTQADSKKIWLKDRFDDGLKFIRLDERGKFFVEYMPIEKVWKPLIGSNYNVINCLWVSGSYKNKGIAKELIQKCIENSKIENKSGIAVVTSKKVMPFLTDKKFFEKYGFETIDEAYPYFELMALKFDTKAENPSFTPKSKKGDCEIKNGFVIKYSNQCPFNEYYVSLYKQIFENLEQKVEIIKLKNYQEAQKFGTPFGTFGVFYNRKFVFHELMAEKKFKERIESIISN